LRTISGELLTTVRLVNPTEAGLVLKAASLINFPSFFEVAFAQRLGQRLGRQLAGSTLPVALQAPSECAPPSDDFWTKFGPGHSLGQ
jgi:hypothetical protein